MATYLDVLFYSLIGGAISLIGGLLLIRDKKSAKKLAIYGTPFAAGALLAAVFVDLLPEGVNYNADQVFIGCMFGFLGFFIFQRVLGSLHHHHDDDEQGIKHNSSRLTIVIGNTAHNALDGVAIGAAFLVSVPTGIVTTIAVAAHEIPHEIGDFALLLSRKMSRRAVIVINIFGALLSSVVAVFVFWLGGSEQIPVGLLLGISAGFLLYIAGSDIIPDINSEAPKKFTKDWQLFLLLAGVAVVWVAVTVADRFIVA
jgi:zinc and cadmium transporter